LEAANVQIAAQVFLKFDSELKMNPGLKSVERISKIQNGDPVNLINGLPGINPSTLLIFMFAPLTKVVTERSSTLN